MASRVANPHRRRFLQTAATAASTAFFAPTIIPSSAIGRDGVAPPSERIILGGIGIGNMADDEAANDKEDVDRYYAKLFCKG